jgi:hypothetical protein
MRRERILFLFHASTITGGVIKSRICTSASGESLEVLSSNGCRGLNMSAESSDNLDESSTGTLCRSLKPDDLSPMILCSHELDNDRRTADLRSLVTNDASVLGNLELVKCEASVLSALLLLFSPSLVGTEK